MEEEQSQLSTLLVEEWPKLVDENVQIFYIRNTQVTGNLVANCDAQVRLRVQAFTNWCYPNISIWEPSETAQKLSSLNSVSAANENISLLGGVTEELEHAFLFLEDDFKCLLVGDKHAFFILWESEEDVRLCAKVGKIEKLIVGLLETTSFSNADIIIPRKEPNFYAICSKIKDRLWDVICTFLKWKNTQKSKIPRIF